MKTNNENTHFKDICTSVLNDFDQKIALIQESEIHTISEDARKTIEHYLKITTETEKRRTDLYTFSLKMFTFAISAIFAILGLRSNQTVNTLIGSEIVKYITLFIATIITPSTITIILYYLQSTFKYPFNELDGVSNQWKWFYYGNEHIKGISTSSFIFKDKTKDIESYIDGLKYFTEKYITSKAADTAKINIIQAYLLQVHNYYKNKWVMQLNNVWKYSICFSTIIVIFFFAYDATMKHFPHILDLVTSYINIFCKFHTIIQNHEMELQQCSY